MRKVTKAVIAAAGFGTRFLPQTKAIPKEMLPIVDKPIIQYVIEELVDAGIKDIIIIVGSNKRTLEDHFDRPSQELVENLKAGGKKKEPLIKEVNDIASLANFIYVRQKGVYGNATPLLNAAHLIRDDEPFIYTFADDFITANPPRFKQMIKAYEKYRSPVISCIKVNSEEDYDRYGFAAGKEIAPGVIDMKSIIEKPGKKDAPSDLASVSSYLLEPNIFKYLREERKKLEKGKEFYFQPAMQAMINDGIKHYALAIENGKFNDSGNKLEYLKTVIEFALKRDDLRNDLLAYIGEICAENHFHLKSCKIEKEDKNNKAK